MKGGLTGCLRTCVRARGELIREKSGQGRRDSPYARDADHGLVKIGVRVDALGSIQHSLCARRRRARLSEQDTHKRRADTRTWLAP